MTSNTDARHGVGWLVVLSIAAVMNLSIVGFSIGSWVLETPNTEHLTAKIVTLSLYAAMAVISLLAVVGTRRGWSRGVVAPLNALSVGWALLASLTVLNLYFFRCAV